MSRTDTDQVIPRERLLEEGAVYDVPEEAIYFCIDHQLFLTNRNVALKHMRGKGHGSPGSVQCKQCLNWFANARELTHHASVAGDTHKLPFPYRQVMVMANDRISGGEESEPTYEHADAFEQGSVNSEMEQTVELPVLKKVMPINMTRIQGVILKKGELI